MRVLNVGESLQLHEKRHFIESLFARRRDSFPGVELFVHMHFVTAGLAGCKARPPHHWHDRVYRYDLPCPVVDVSARLKLLYEKIGLFTVELLIECLRLAAEQVELPQCILGQRKVVIGERFVDELKDLLWDANLVQGQKDARTSLEDPVEIGVVRQAISEC